MLTTSLLSRSLLLEICYTGAANTEIPLALLAQAVRYRRHRHSLQMMRSVGKSGAGSKQHILHKLRTGVPAKQASLATPLRRAAKAEPKLGIVAAIRKRSQFVNRLCIIYCRCLAPFSFCFLYVCPSHSTAW